MSAASAPPKKWSDRLRPLILLMVIFVFVLIPITKVTGIDVFGLGFGSTANAPSLTSPFPGLNDNGTGDGNATPGTGTASPSPTTTSPRQVIIDQAKLDKNTQELRDEGYEPVDVLEMAPTSSIPGSNGQLATVLDSVTGRQGTYVVFRSQDKGKTLASQPDSSYKPDRIVMLGTSTANDGDIVAYYQAFANRRGAMCLSNDKVKLSDPVIWKAVGDALWGKSLGGDSTTLTSADTGLSGVITGDTRVECNTFRPEEERMQD